jgi:hypothetical protein
MERERQRHLAALALGFHGGVELAKEAHPALVAEAQHIAGHQPLRRLHESAPARAIEPPMQRRLDRGLGIAAADAAACQTRRDDPGIVDHQSVARPQEVRQVAHRAVLEFRHLPGAHDQEPGGVAGRDRTQRDPVGRQMEIEQIGAHSRIGTRE